MPTETLQAEAERIEALCTLNLLDSPPEERFDRIVRLAARHFDAPIALLSLLDERRQWFKSRHGLAVQETPRSAAFCRFAVASGELLIVEDAQLDPRFRDNPLVTGSPNIRFYAGQPVRGADGFVVATLCVIDVQPRRMTELQLDSLRCFAELVEEEIKKTAVVRGNLRKREALRESEARFQATFEQAAVGLAHVSMQGTWLKVNGKLCEITGYSREELEVRTFQDITLAEDLSQDLSLVNELLANQRNSYSLEKRYLQKSGAWIWVNLTVSLVRRADGTPDYFISVVEDIQAKKAAQQALVKLNEELEARVAQRTQDLQDRNQALALEIQHRQRVEDSLRTSEERIHTIIDGSLDAFVAIDSRGIITDWNRAAETIFGWTRQEAVGKPLTATIIPMRHQEAHHQGMKKFQESGQGAVVNKRIELPGRTKSGKEIPVEMTITAYQQNGEHFFAAFLHDISAKKEAASKLEQKQNLLDAVLETVDVGVVACSQEGELTLFNRAARELHRLTPELVLDTNMASYPELFSSNGQNQEERPIARALRGENVQDVEVSMVTAAGRDQVMLVSGRPLRGCKGEKLGAVIAVKDVTELKESNARLARNEQRLRSITDNLPALIGQADRDGKLIFLNRKSESFFGRREQELLGKHVQFAYGDDEYRKIKPHIDSALAGNKVSFEGEFNVDGAKRHFQAVYLPDREPSGAVNGFFAMAFDITARKSSELRQAESEERLRTIADNLPALIAYVDQDMRYRFANGKYREWYGHTPAEMLGRSIIEVFGTDYFEQRKDHILRCLAGQAVRFEIAGEIGGRASTIESTYIPHQRDGMTLGFYVLATDITQVKDQERQLQLLARSDVLTGLPNRRSYEEKLQDAVSRASRSGKAIALMFLDVDHFKKVNDSLGHAGGDEVLREFARRLRQAVRGTDTVCRLAGDEFTVVLEGLNALEDANTVAQKIVDAVREPFQIGERRESITTSIGIAYQLAAQASTESLAKEADDALYKAKAAGRNGYFLASLGEH